MKPIAKPFAIFNLILFLGVLTVNALANILPIGGLNTGEVSDLYPNLFVPAGLTFSIWGIIYLLLAIFVAWSFVKAWSKAGSSQLLLRISPLFWVSCVLNMAWIFAWQYLFVISSLLIMLGLLASLLLIHQRLWQWGNSGEKVPLAAKVAFSVYLGWISLATIANATTLLVHFGWNGWGLSESGWTLVMISVAILLSVVFLLRRKDGFYVLPIAWALLGIYIKRSASVPAYPSIEYLALVGAVIVFLAGIGGMIKWGVHPPENRN